MTSSETGYPLAGSASSAAALAYKQAGVDLDTASAVATLAGKLAKPTRLPFLLGGIGSFSAAFEIPSGYRQPILLAACDGVGTKLKLALDYNKLDGLGIDLVAMSVNDLLCNGAKPLVFLDYYAAGHIRLSDFEVFLTSLADGCKQANCALAGGETAEMPGLYEGRHFDVAGFCVGIAEKADLRPFYPAMKAGDCLIGLGSTGPHSNGYSLIRKVLTDSDVDPQQPVASGEPPLIETLLAPTAIYVAPVLKLFERYGEDIKAVAHITGGGFYENIPRVLPEGLAAQIDTDAWPRPAVFNWLQQAGQLDDATLFQTFNAGIGLVMVVEAAIAEAILADDALQGLTYQALNIGQLVAKPNADSPNVLLSGV